MKSPIYRILHKVFATYIVFWFSLFIAAALTKISKPFGALIPTVITFVAVLLFVGAMLLIWRREVYWTPRKKTATLLLTVLAMIFAPAGLLSGNLFFISLLAAMPMMLFLTWSPARHSHEPMVQEEDFGVSIRLYNSTVSKLMTALTLWGPAAIICVGLGDYLDIDLAGFSMVACLTTATLWTLIWHSATNWTKSRIAFSFLAIILAALAEASLLIFMVLDDSNIYDYPLGIVGLPVFIILTTRFWQNTSAERRSARANPKLYRHFNDTPYCAECGFNLTGLEKLRCPECGRQYTLARIIYENVRMRDLDMQLDIE